MKVFLREIINKTAELTDTMPASVLGFSADDYLKFTRDLDIKASVQKIDDTVVANVCVESRYTSFCFRCLVPLEKTFQKKFVLDYEVEKGTEFIEMDDEIRQEVILNLPNSVLCQDDCLGICKACGIDLNKEKCNCNSSDLLPVTGVPSGSKTSHEPRDTVS